MFNIGLGELVVIFIIALLFWGPNALPEIGRSLGKLVRAMRDFAHQMRGELGPAARELDEIHETVENIRNPIAAFTRGMLDPVTHQNSGLSEKTENAARSHYSHNAKFRSGRTRMTTEPDKRRLPDADDDYLSMNTEREYALQSEPRARARYPENSTDDDYLAGELRPGGRKTADAGGKPANDGLKQDDER